MFFMENGLFEPLLQYVVWNSETKLYIDIIPGIAGGHHQGYTGVMGEGIQGGNEGSAPAFRNVGN